MPVLLSVARLFWRSVFASLLVSSAAIAQVPTRQEDIPLYPGAVSAPDWDEVSELFGRSVREELDGLALVSRTLKWFEVVQTREQFASGDLLKFYVARLGATRLARGAEVPADRPGKAYYAAEPEGAAFTWYVRRDDGTVTRLCVSMPPGRDAGSGNYRMPLAIMSETYAPADRVKTPIPGERELGWPVYPGSVYAATESSGGPITAVSVFYTGDSLQKVLAFFETTLGIKAGQGEPSPGRVSYFLQRSRGPLYEVDHVILEEDPGVGGRAKTRISYSLAVK